ncbi:Store-operated calcium entry-associated regulatory factor [Aphelenchoides besseyi]|nr:Store-operated calcium entry-associated regulatory factor [Aphelenchoides besseyi]KAI6194264.1 Store-operated calcium entry-associated regulatory factor [Aphelenchoides besseyi]
MKWKWVFSILSIIFLQVEAVNRVLLRDVTSITLHRGQYTTGRRSSPVPQLQCVGGTAQGKFAPKTVQCYNRGFDGLDVQWECQADMPREYQFGKISVSCEGFDYPNDPFILAGSCGLKYELDYSSAGVHGGSYLPKPSTDNYTYLVYVIFIGFILYLLYLSFTNTREGNEGDRRGGYGGGYSGGDDYPGGGGPSPYGWRPSDAPPSYDDAQKGTSRGTSRTQGNGSNYGFWSGMGLGALGGYLFNNYYNRGNNYDSTFRRRHTQFERDTGFGGSSYYDQPSTSGFYDNPSTSSSSNTHTSSGFGGTERR